jgi:hypothetical protein
MNEQVGVLLLENTHQKSGRAIDAAATFAPPPRLATVAGAQSPIVLGADGARLADAYASAASELVADGTALVTANCGFAFRYQAAVRNRVDAPVALSSLLLLGTLRQVYGRRLGVLTYDAATLRSFAKDIEGWPADGDLALCDIGGSPAWAELAQPTPIAVNLDAMEADLLQRSAQFVAAQDLRALLLECTAMFLFARRLEDQLGVRCFDLIDLIHFIRGAPEPATVG